MLRTMESMEDYTIGATDGLIGHVQDFYFDDAAWVVRYLVVETGDWLGHRKVLISPISVREPNWKDKVFPVSITKAQVKGSPSIDTNKPVSRQHEEGYLRYFDYPYYWGGAGLWGGGLSAGALAFENPDYGSALCDAEAMASRQAAETSVHGHGNPHLRSGNTVMHYHMHATDGNIGHVKGLLVDDKTWAIRYLVVGTSDWWGGHDVLIAPEWIDDINWSEGRVVVDLSRQAIKDSPAYDSAKPLVRELETGTFKHYGRDGYWPREGRQPASRPSA
jgi:PRC-barrel domain